MNLYVILAALRSTNPTLAVADRPAPSRLPASCIWSERDHARAAHAISHRIRSRVAGEIVADQPIAEKVPAEVWGEAMADMLACGPVVPKTAMQASDKGCRGRKVQLVIRHLTYKSYEVSGQPFLAALYSQ